MHDDLPPDAPRPNDAADADAGDASAEPTGRAGVRAQRPPLDDFLAYLDGTLGGPRREQFEAYLSRNREARRRLNQLARLEALLPDHLVLDTILSDARASARRRSAGDASGSTSTALPAALGRSDAMPAPVAPLPEDRFDETLLAAWIDGALTREERAELARRLDEPVTAAAFYREAQTVKRASEVMQQASPPPEDGYGRLLLHLSRGRADVLDAAPTAAGGGQRAVERAADGTVRLTMPFPALPVQLEIHAGYRGLTLRATPAGPVAAPEARFVLTDEAGRRMFASEPLVAGTPVELAPLQPGVYRLTAPPTPVAMVLCINGELGTTEIHRLLGL